MDIEAVLAVMTGFGLVVVVPLVAMLLYHQRKMAAFIHGEHTVGARLADRLDRMQAEINELKSAVAEEIIRLDDREQSLRQRLRESPPAG